MVYVAAVASAKFDLCVNGGTIVLDLKGKHRKHAGFRHSFFHPRLRNAGFTEEQAEIFADEQRKLIEQRLATKQDIKELDAHIKETEMRMETRMAELKVELIRWIIGLILVQAGFIVVMIKLNLPDRALACIIGRKATPS